MRFLERLTVMMALSMVLLTACGKDDDDDNPVGSGHDFGQNDASVVAAVGNSLTAGIGVTPYPAFLGGMIGKSVHNHGIPGARSDAVLSRALSVLSSLHPGYMIIMAGTNDVNGGVPPEEVIANLRAIVDAARANQTVPILMTVTPGYYSWESFDQGYQNLNAQVRSLAGEMGVTWVDNYPLISIDLMQADGLHPTEDGNQKIATAVANVF
jgi:lysophospholipase L1-like esterase